jgi:hypothetical protein
MWKDKPDHLKDETMNNDDNDEYNTKNENTIRLYRLLLDKQCNKKIKTRTGFDTLHQFLSFLAVACGGDIKLISKRVSILPPFKEWVLAMGVINGKNIFHWCDAEDQFKINAKTCRKIFDDKTTILLKTRASWPTYAT